jgi:NAD dependent epimerase/dehydratase family enzyme
MKIVIAGASGFVGSALTRSLLDAGHAVTGLGTSTAHPLESMARFKWHAADTTRAGDWQAVVGDADAVVNLAGRTIFKRWSKAYKAQLIDSRILTTRNLVSAMTGENNILISTSAVGYYGSRGDQVLTEDSPPGTDFLARLSVDWENAALDAAKKGDTGGHHAVRRGAGCRRGRPGPDAAGLSHVCRRSVGTRPAVVFLDSHGGSSLCGAIFA